MYRITITGGGVPEPDDVVVIPYEINLYYDQYYPETEYRFNDTAANLTIMLDGPYDPNYVDAIAVRYENPGSPAQ